MSKHNISRRRFLVGSAALGAGAFCSQPHRLWAADGGQPVGSNDAIRVAIIGFNGRGAALSSEVRKNKGVRIVALCDADAKVLATGMKRAADLGEKVEGFQDLRKVLDSKNVDAVVTATPNHWHSLVTVWACQAGKDVYVEKPVSHNIWEGRKCVEAAAKYKRMVQVGTQRRSDRGFQELVKFIQSGQMGKILVARAFCYKERNSIGKVTEPTPIPANIDYDLWCGPAAKLPLMRKNLHYDWHWVWNTGNGDIGNQGIHEMDQCRWILGYEQLAPRVYSVGNRWGYVDDAETPNTQFAILDYPIPLIHEVRGLKRKAGDKVMDNFKGVRIGIVIECEGGYYAAGENGGWCYDNKGQKIKQFVQDGAGEHTNNFFKAVRSRNVADLTAPILGGHISSALCHMANISYRLGKEAPASVVADSLKSSKVAADAWERMQQHLAANEVKLEEKPAVMGPVLSFDPDAERFTGQFADRANTLVRREYRAPFVIPDQV